MKGRGCCLGLSGKADDERVRSPRELSGLRDKARRAASLRALRSGSVIAAWPCEVVRHSIPLRHLLKTDQPLSRSWNKQDSVHRLWEQARCFERQIGQGSSPKDL